MTCLLGLSRLSWSHQQREPEGRRGWRGRGCPRPAWVLAAGCRGQLRGDCGLFKVLSSSGPFSWPPPVPSPSPPHATAQPGRRTPKWTLKTVLPSFLCWGWGGLMRIKPERSQPFWGGGGRSCGRSLCAQRRVLTPHGAQPACRSELAPDLRAGCLGISGQSSELTPLHARLQRPRSLLKGLPDNVSCVRVAPPVLAVRPQGEGLCRCPGDRAPTSGHSATLFSPTATVTVTLLLPPPLPPPTSAWLVTRPLPVPWTPLRPALGYPGSNPVCPHSLLPPWACCVGTTAPRLHHACNTPHQSSRTKHRFREALWRISGRPPWVTPDLALPRQHGPDTSLAQVQEPGTAPTPNTHLCEAAQG